MIAPERVFVAYGKHGASTVSEYRDEAEAQHGTPATEYVDAAEVTRLRAALQAIAGLQPTEPPALIRPDCDGHCNAGQAYFDHGVEVGQWKASSLAAAALGGGT